MLPDPPADGPVPARPEAPVRALATGLAVLRSFTPGRPALTVSSAAEAAGITRATARRVLHTLVHEGFAVQEGREFRLTPRVLELGHGYWTGTSLAELLRPVLARASQALEQSCSAAVLDGAFLLYIARVHTERIIRVNLDVGTRLPAFLTSMGRVLLADLPPATARRLLQGTPRTPRTPETVTDVSALLAELARVREQDHAVVTAELDPHLSSVAVPVRGPDGAVVAAINTALPHRSPGAAGPSAAEQTRAAVDAALPVLREAARDAEDALVALRR
ncbi:IclR family transcriptional regulator domain-containing protein [Micrococcus luteus]|uniref:IclR family transcriptional regulator domain-containing protein n=1 Tax=Micrococcus luteus TaxID=1270 RepID=UPI000C79B08A|nr:IclR family transcriptional regulator C-terminal domain-containing protein [Micrococcus luteus]MCV7527884.1 helix-turn-helix domain-containing protein [Micrococcus luteus]PLA45817.1 IclR family transcriptional regulator [Micrococcus luteus]